MNEIQTIQPVTQGPNKGSIDENRKSRDTLPLKVPLWIIYAEHACTPAHYCRLLDHLGDKCPKTINLMWPNTVYTAHTNIAAGGLQCLVRYKNQLYFKLIIFQRKTLKKKQKNNSFTYNSRYSLLVRF